MEALQEWDIPYDPILVQPGDYQIQSGYEAMLRLLALANPPDAVFAANDLMAIGALIWSLMVTFRIWRRRKALSQGQG